MPATYEFQSYSNRPTPYRVAGVAKLRLRDDHVCVWNSDGDVVLMVPFGYVLWVQRVDIDTGMADERVVELVDAYGTVPDQSATVHTRIPGVHSMELKVSASGYQCLVLNSDDDDLPAALVKSGNYTLRRQGVTITAVP